MKARPILFSGPMVRALLDGRKTQTRRIVKLTPKDGVADNRFVFEDINGKFRFIDCPYGRPRDLLWVRETWGETGSPMRVDYKADAGPITETARMSAGLKWKPSIHMPRYASRLTLRITAVRVERLQDISEEDAISEGIELLGGPTSCSPWKDYSKDQRYKFFSAPSASYCSLWESINGPESWDQNPFVWVIQFEVIHANVDKITKQQTLLQNEETTT